MYASRLLKNMVSFSQLSQKHEVPKYAFAKDIPETVQRNHMNLFTAINSAIDISLETDPTYTNFFMSF
jgi:hypothetical protein